MVVSFLVEGCFIIMTTSPPEFCRSTLFDHNVSCCRHQQTLPSAAPADLQTEVFVYFKGIRLQVATVNFLCQLDHSDYNEKCYFQQLCR